MGRYATLTKDLPDDLRIAHPICVLKKVREKGYDPKTAPKHIREESARECIREGKLHGIAKLMRK
jgi:hypothetical protein